MRLLGVDIKGFRRFLDADITLDADPIAVIGRNEAGKSSLLAALTRLNDSNGIERPDQTRGHPSENSARVLTAWFALEDDDKLAIKSIREASKASRYLITKSVDGAVRGRFDPPVLRELSTRGRVSVLVGRVAKTKWYEESELDEEQWKAVSALLASTAESLTTADLETIAALAAALPEEPARALPVVLRHQLQDLAERESQDSPSKQAAAILLPRRPQFVLFGPEHRELRTVYDLEVDAGAPPPALANIAHLAGLSLTSALDAFHESDYGRLEKLERDANTRLQQFFSTAWRQSAMHVQLRIDGSDLRILVDNLEGDLTSIGERSAGLQTFVALVAFLANEDYARPPVVLIDEAETHLHYDAQADLVRVLSEQDAAAKVIYTTHSAGCLPLDLGLGVRAVLAEPADLSRIENSVWELGHGLSPMLLAMGASVLAFSRARRAIIGEGASEAQLLPSLLRESVPSNEVDYQVAPGVANATKEAIEELDFEAVTVGYVLDGDKGGRDHAAHLKASGIPDRRITYLGGSPTSGVTLEDLVAREVYHRAVNAVLATWHPGKVLPLSSIPPTGRASALKKWSSKEGISPPDKTLVAARVLAERGNPRDSSSAPRRLTTRQSRGVLAQLHAEILRMLQRPAAPEETPKGVGDGSGQVPA